METRSPSKPHLVKRILWRQQATAEGWGHWPPPELLARARELADLSLLRARPPEGVLDETAPVSRTGRVRASINRRWDPRLPKVGCVLVRRYKGRDVRVVVRPVGFEHDGRLYWTLSAAAREISQSHVNGFRWFKLGPAKRGRDVG